MQKTRDRLSIQPSKQHIENIVPVAKLYRFRDLTVSTGTEALIFGHVGSVPIDALEFHRPIT